MVLLNGRKMKKLIISLCLCVSVFQLLSCSSGPENPTMVDQLPAIYPDYVGVTIPAEIAPLNFNSTEADVDCIERIHAKGVEFDVRKVPADNPVVNCMLRVILPISMWMSGTS